MNILIIEDEETAAERLQKMLLQADSQVNILAVTESVKASLAWLRNHPAPDLIMADIQLADGPSFEIFRQLEVQAPLIFTTAYDEYAIKAFKYNSIDYLLKPIKKAELEESLGKYKKLRQSQAMAGQREAAGIETTSAPENFTGTAKIDFEALLQQLKGGGKAAYQKRLLIRFGQTIRMLELADVAYFYTEERVSLACTRAGKCWPVDHPLDELEGILDPQQFFRINRQFIIHIGAIGSMQAYSKSRVKVRLNPPASQETIVSAERSPAFKEWLLGK